CASTPWYFDVW
nr:immunoglobulin heavy chain junction region [Mus musculus]MBK4184364.1 immunoglobulin heavy chain junction region [Mus musculus]